MLVRFMSQATANLLMFDDVARSLLTVIGKSPTQRGVITVDEMPAALTHLNQMIEHEKRLKDGKEPREERPLGPVVGINRSVLVYRLVAVFGDEELVRDDGKEVLFDERVRVDRRNES